MNKREKMCEIARMLYERGLVSGTDGNISVKTEDNTVLITPSGVNKGMLEPEQLLELSMEGAVISGSGKASRESGMHLGIYQTRQEINAVIHTHPSAATAFAVCGRTLPDNCLIEVKTVIGRIGLAGYAPAGSQELADEVKREAADADVIFLQNHGVITCGTSLMAAFNRMDAVENAAKTICQAKIIGEIKYF